MQSPPTKSAASAALLTLFLALAVEVTGDTSAGARARYETRTTRVAPGMRYSRMVDSRGPNQIRVLRVDPSSSLTIDVALSNNALPGYETTSSMAGRHRALAAINGDYSVPPGRPVNTFAEDGTLKTSPLIWGRNFAIARNEQRSFIGHAQLSIWLALRRPSATWSVGPWNVARQPRGSLAGYTPAGGRAFRPPRNACSVRLAPSGRLEWARSKRGLRRAHVVRAVRCGTRRLERRGGIVIAAARGTEHARRLRASLSRGERVHLGWSLGWSRVLDTVGGNPDLLRNGSVSVGRCPRSASFCKRHPRTGVGVTRSGQLLLVTVDGRQPGRSVGMTPWEFARLFQHLGARRALNLDGGGSTTMVVDGSVVNRPSDGRERAVSSALLVLRSRDRPEPTPAAPRRRARPRRPRQRAPQPPPPLPPLPPLPSLPPLPPPASPALPLAAGPGCLALLDGASSGGLLDALARGHLRARRGLAGDLDWAVEAFRQRSCG